MHFFLPHLNQERMNPFMYCRQSQPSHKSFVFPSPLADDRKVQISSQMAAMALLGYPSWHGSHKFVVVNPWQYVTTLRLLFRNRPDFAELERVAHFEEEEGWTSAEDSDRVRGGEEAFNVAARFQASRMAVDEGEGNDAPILDVDCASGDGEDRGNYSVQGSVGGGGVEAVPGTALTVQEDTAFLTQGVVDIPNLGPEDGTDDKVGAEVFVIQESGFRRLIGVPAAYNYAFRGHELRHLCALEYALLVEVSKEAPHDISTGQGGRQRNARFEFHPKHKLASSEYVQRLVGQLRCPIMAGKHLPAFPSGDLGNMRGRQLWAAYVCTLFVPWDADHPPVCTWDAMVAWEMQAKRVDAPYVERARYDMVQRLKSQRSLDKVAKLVSDLARQRWRKMWGVVHPLDIAFSRRDEEAEARRMRTEDREARYAQALEEVAVAIEKETSVAAAADPREDEVGVVVRLLLGRGGPNKASETRRQNESPLFEGFAERGGSTAGDDGEATGQGKVERGLPDALTEAYNAIRIEDARENQLSDSRSVPNRGDLGCLLDRIPVVHQLDADQERVVQTVVRYVALEAVSEEGAKPPAPLLFVHAGPGAGKSATAAELRDRLTPVFGEGVVVCIAPTGVAAANLVQGSTCHHAVALTVYGDAANGGDVPGFDFYVEDKDVLHRMRLRFQSCRVVIIDEASMVRCEMLRDIDRRLRQVFARKRDPFGGVAVVLMGDFVQLPPVGGGDLDQSLLLRSVHSFKSGSIHSVFKF